MRQKLCIITQNLRLPSICILCNQFHKNALAVCFKCIELIQHLGPTCQQCSYPIFDTSYALCGQCVLKPPCFDRVIVAYPFEEPLRSLLHDFKYHEGLYLASFLCELMLRAWFAQSNMTQCLIPVPMHPKKLRVRGYNQAAVLTKRLAEKLGCPYDLTSCKKIINTRPQAQLDSEERQKNLQGSFSIDPLPFEHVTVIDDLLTTGSTANELAKALKKSGVKRVDIWCCARTGLLQG